MKRRGATTRSIAPLLRIDSNARQSLQTQLRARIVSAISDGVLTPGMRLPSSRALADELNISRNTVSIAYQHLIADGHLVTRERSGIFVASAPAPVPDPADAGTRIAAPARGGAHSIAGQRIRTRIPPRNGFRCPLDWQDYPYPFIEGRHDKSLFPVADWREASRMALAVREVEQWSVDNVEADDALLVEQIRTKLLPRRGIQARPEEILVTAGEQQALHLLVELFGSPGAHIGVEMPGLPAVRNLIALRGAVPGARSGCACPSRVPTDWSRRWRCSVQ